MGRWKFDVLFLGYFGFGNLGDELLLELTARAVRQAVPDARLAALSGPRGLSSGASRMVHTVPRSDRLAARAVMSSARVVCVGPGGIFQDATSLRSCTWYGLQTWRAARARARVVHIGQSLGPLETRLGRMVAARALRRGQAVVLRDEPSLALAQELQVPARAGADLAWLLAPPTSDRIGPRDSVGLAPRPWPDSRADAAWWGQVYQGVAGLGLRPMWLPMAPEDVRLAQAAERLIGKREETLRPLPGGAQALAAMGSCRAVVAMRLHALILSCLAGAQPLGLSYDPKIDGLLERIGRVPVCSVDDPLSPAALVDRLREDPDTVPVSAIEHERRLASVGVEAILTTLREAREAEPGPGT